MEESEGIARARDLLLETGCVEELRDADDDVQDWLDDELSNFVEGRLGEESHERPMNAERRRDWLVRAILDGKLYPPHTGYWIVAGGERVGTVATLSVGNGLVSVGSLYVKPRHRKLGHARRVLEAIRRSVVSAGLWGIRLESSWCWEPSVRLCLRDGMWVRGWKRDLTFTWYHDLPPWSVEREGDEARFVLHGDTDKQRGVAIVARRAGERLQWSETALMDPFDQDTGEVPHLAPGTFAAWLALEGFPIITSDAAWREQLALGWSDMGGPEGLAFTIRIWEAWQRRTGWQVRAPRIPGLSYPTWEEIERERAQQ